MLIIGSILRFVIHIFPSALPVRAEGLGPDWNLKKQPQMQGYACNKRHYMLYEFGAIWNSFRLILL